eukprot:403335355
MNNSSQNNGDGRKNRQNDQNNNDTSTSDFAQILRKASIQKREQLRNALINNVSGFGNQSNNTSHLNKQDLQNNSASQLKNKIPQQLIQPINQINNGNYTNLFPQNTKSMIMDANQLKLQKQKLLGQTLEKLQKDMQGNKDFYLKMRKEYDRITIYENMFNRQKEQQKEFKNLKKNMKKLVDHFFLPMFPMHQLKMQAKHQSQSSKAKLKDQLQLQKRQSRQQSLGRKKLNNNNAKSGNRMSRSISPQQQVTNSEDASSYQSLLYEAEFQQILDDRLDYYQDDLIVNSLQISYFQILNFLEKIVETELYILEGQTVIPGDPNSMDLLTYHGMQIQARAILKEQQTILKFIKLERFYLFIFWTFSKILSTGLTPPIKERDFVYKRCMGSLKRLRQLIYSLNYLLTDKKRYQLYMLNQNEPKHILLLKTLYGMADEMMSKNFIEEKKTNQKNMFDKDYIESSKTKEQKSSNFEDLIQSLKDQLSQIDFTEDEYDQYSYVDQNDMRASATLNSQNNYGGQNQGQNQSITRSLKSSTQLQQQQVNQYQQKYMQNQQENPQTDYEIDEGEQFLESLGFKDPFHKKLLNQDSQNSFEQRNNTQGGYGFQQPQDDGKFQHYMTHESQMKVQKLLTKNPGFSTVMHNLLNSAYNPFQEGLPFISDTSFKKRFASSMMKKFKTRGTLSWIYSDLSYRYKNLDQNDQQLDDDEDEDWDQPFDVIELFSFFDSGKQNVPVQQSNHTNHGMNYQQNQQGTIYSNSNPNQNQRNTMGGESVFTDSERFERLVNCDFSFKKRYGNNKQIEDKYAEIMMQQQMDRFKNPNSKIAEFFKQQILSEEIKKDQSHDNSQSSQSKMMKAIKEKLNNQFFGMIKDELNPYKEKRGQTNRSNGGLNAAFGTFGGRNISDTNGSSQYWRRFSSSREQSIKDSRSFHNQFQSLGSLSNRRRSVNTAMKGLGFGSSRNAGMTGGGTFDNRYLGGVGNDQDSEQDFGFFNAINNHQISNTSGYFKKRSATIHVRSTIKDIQEEDDLKSKQSDGRRKGDIKNGHMTQNRQNERDRSRNNQFNHINQQSSMQSSSNNSNRFMAQTQKRATQMRKPSSGIYLRDDVLN